MGLRPEPFYLGVVFAVAGLMLSLFFVRDSRGHARHEAALRDDAATRAAPSFREIFALTSWKDRRLFAVSQAGLVNNLNDGMAWGLFPLFFAAGGLAIEQIAILAAIYPAVWGLGQLGTGALSDHVGRKPLITGGMARPGPGHLRHRRELRGSLPGPLARRSSGWAPRWSTRRCWRRSATSPTRNGGPRRSGSTGSGAMAGTPSGRCWPASWRTCLGLRWAIGAVGVLTLVSGVVVATVMTETLASRQRARVPSAVQPTPGAGAL